MIDEPRFAQSLGNLFGIFALSFKGIDPPQLNEVGHFDLDRHGAAVGGTGVAHARFVTRPGVSAVDVYDAYRRSHASILSTALVAQRLAAP